MAVQAQYHHHPSLFLARSVQESKTDAIMEFPAPPPQQQQQEQPPLFLDFSNGGGGNTRKRPREVAVSLQPAQQASANRVISLAQLQKRPPPVAAPTTGLRLDFDDQSEHVSCTSASSLLSDELAAQFNQHKNEMDQFLHEQGERLRRTLAEARRRHYRALLGAAEATAARRLRETEEAAGRAARRGAELEDRLARLRTESAAWQAKALADQATAAALHTQLQQVAAVAAARAQAAVEDSEQAAAGAAPADDAESAYVDPDRVELVVVAEPPARLCRSCRLRPATVVFLPCRHLCVCDSCESAVGCGGRCPVCRCVSTGTVQVFLS